MGFIYESPWARVHKGTTKARQLADRHYTRQNPGHPMWTRPGYNYVLLAEYESGSALFCWWRPKWEDGRPGTARRDGLRVLECTMFRREGQTHQSSYLIRSAVDALQTPYAQRDLKLASAGPIDRLITGVSAKKTSRRRSKRSSPGECFLRAGWAKIENKKTRRADIWLSYPWENPF
jgi:hypothetical protein